MSLWPVSLSFCVLLCLVLPLRASTTSPKASNIVTDLSDCSLVQVTTTNFPVFDGGWLNQSHWTLLVNGVVQTLEPGDIKQGLSQHQLILKMTATPTALASACSAGGLNAVTAALKKVEVLVLFDGKQLSAAGPPVGDPLVSVTGSISPNVTSPAQYTLDSSGQFVWTSRSKNFSFGPVGTMKADSRQGVDPDSITLSGLFQRVVSRSRDTDGGLRKEFLGSQLNLFAPGIETSRKDTTRNLITGFAYVQAIRVRSQLKPESTFFPSLLVGLGIEGGKNFKSLSTPTSGLGAIARGYGSADFQATLIPTHSHNRSTIPYLK